MHINIMVLKSFFLNYYIVTIIITTIVTVNKANDFKCSKVKDDFKCRLSTMTPYRFIANYDDDEIKFPGNTYILLLMFNY